MRRVVSNTVDAREVDSRVALLGKKFPGHKFIAEDHETRKRIVVESKDQIDTPDFEQMVRVATTGQ